MTEIHYQRTGEKVRISVVGHAAYNPGNDIVCAGVSAITFQLLGVLADLDDDKMIYEHSLDVNDGFVIVQFSLVPEAFELWNIIWMVIEKGWKNIAEEYPDHVVVS